MDSSVNPQELLDLALFVSLVLTVLVLMLLGSYLRQRAARGRAERALGRAQAYMSTILDAAAPGIIVVNEDGAVEAFNLSAERMFGYGAIEIVGRKISGFKLFAAPPANGGNAGDPFSAAFVSSTAAGGVGVQALGCRKNGTTFPAELFVGEGRLGPRRVLVAVVQDISSRSKAEQRAAQAPSGGEDLADWIGAMIVMLDGSGRTLRINRACQQATGYRQEEVEGQFFWDVFPAASDAGAVRREFQEAGRRGVARQGESDWLTKDRRLRRIVWRLTREPEGQEGEAGFIIAGMDITDYVQRSEEAARARATAALEAFADALAVRLTGSLTAVQGYAELVLAGSAAGEETQKEIQEIQRAAGQAAELACQLQAFGRGQILTPKLLDVNALLSGMVAELRRKLAGRAVLELMLAAAIGKVRVDPAKFQSAIERMVERLARRLGNQPRIVLRTLEVQGAGGEPCVMVAVIAPDLELAADECGRMFQPFAAESAGGETGLEMAAVYGFLRQSGADVHAVSRKDGTRLEIYLPRAEPADALQSSRLYAPAKQ